VNPVFSPGRRRSDELQDAYRVGPEQAGLRADLFLGLQAAFLSRSLLKRKIMRGEVLVNGNRLSTSTRLREGDTVEIRYRPGDDPSPPWVPAILFEDAHLLAVDKPAGVPVHPAGRKQAGTVIQAVRDRLREEIARSLLRGDPAFYPCLVNRLDLFSSGVVLIAKHRQALLAMHRLIARGGVEKRYLAIVRGRVEPRSGRLTDPIGRDEFSRIELKRAVRADGLPAVTEYETLQALNGYTLVAARPLTGRQHQIRVHFAACGHPVWGDLLYADESLFQHYLANGCRLDPSLPPRQGLHAERVRFLHPLDGREVEVVALPPENFLRILAGLRL
jgi:23S rRNA pseudouridine1911/1915/1917 synthase